MFVTSSAVVYNLKGVYKSLPGMLWGQNRHRLRMGTPVRGGGLRPPLREVTTIPQILILCELIWHSQGMGNNIMACSKMNFACGFMFAATWLIPELGQIITITEISIKDQLSISEGLFWFRLRVPIIKQDYLPGGWSWRCPNPWCCPQCGWGTLTAESAQKHPKWWMRGNDEFLHLPSHGYNHVVARHIAYACSCRCRTTDQCRAASSAAICQPNLECVPTLTTLMHHPRAINELTSISGIIIWWLPCLCMIAYYECVQIMSSLCMIAVDLISYIFWHFWSRNEVIDLHLSQSVSMVAT